MAFIYKRSASEDAPSAVDQDIRKYIEQTEDNNYEGFIENDLRWEVFCHLSDIPTGLFSWYDFSRDASLLEIDAGFGSLTGLFCNKCKKVVAVEESAFRAEAIHKRHEKQDNLTIYTGKKEDILFSGDFTKQFDYVILTGGLEKAAQGSPDKKLYIDYINRLLTLLKPNGVLLLSVDNRYGLRYFCGIPDAHTEIPFAGINQYQCSTYGRTFAKNELKEILNRSNVKKYKFYYPLPDYKLPQLIYTDEHLPEKNLKERLIPYYENNKTIVFPEHLVYDDIIENRVFDFFSNSYLLECGATEASIFSRAVYAALSTDRGRNIAFATVIYNNDTVQKIPVFEEGKLHAQNLVERTNELVRHGISVVPHYWTGEAISMPYIEAETLANYLRKVVKRDPKEFIFIVDQLWNCIINSSEQVDDALNALKTEKQYSWGPILKTVYMELIPLNSFYLDQKILFFDQEYVKENYPAKYALFRALYYIYAFSAEAEQCVPLQYFKEKYELMDIWDIFLKEENEIFQPKVRKRELYQLFYKKTQIDSTQMFHNAKLLGTDDGIKLEYKAIDHLKNIWEIQFGLLKTFIEVCEKWHLKYFVIDATLLGAVRHQGFIPWDNVVSIAMPRECYDRLQMIAETVLFEPYFLQTMENDPDCFFGGFLRLRNSNTTAITSDNFGHACNQGIWIDILPLDTCKIEHLKKQQWKMKLLQNLLYAKIYGNKATVFLTKAKWKVCGYIFIGKILKHAYLCKKLNDIMRVYNHDISEYVTIFPYLSKLPIFNATWFSESKKMKFGDLLIEAPIGYQKCLEISMGKEYMQYPPMEERRPQQYGIFHKDIPYKRYMEVFMGLFNGCIGKKIIVFGVGHIFKTYMEKYGDQYRPYFLVDNDLKKWGRNHAGIQIYRPESILSVPENDRYVIICSVYYKEIACQLEKMGIYQYKICIFNKPWILQE